MSGEIDESAAVASAEREWESFREFQSSGNDRGGFETDDILTAVLPLMEQVCAAHERGRVAPLAGLEDLRVTHGQLWYHEGAEREPAAAAGNLRCVEGDDRGKFFDVVDRTATDSDLDAGRFEVTNRRVWVTDESPVQPVYVTRYRNWEHLCGHHDALTDIYSLGMLLAAMATGLDLATEEGLESFADNRESLHMLCPRLHPVVASVIVRMTALRRRERLQDLRAVMRCLRNYRDQSIVDDLRLMQDPGFVSAPLHDRRQMIHAKLRDRLFEISKRNRLIFFRATMQSVNLTVSSVPLMLDYRNIRPEQLFTWQPRLAEALANEEEIPLNRYLRFEDAAYLPHALDTIRRDANRDRKEYGFAQLRLVLVFFRWHNLKDEPETRIHSPLLLHPVELVKKKGVRDSHHLRPVGTVAEVNPALRHFLKQLYDLELPEAIDLAETSLEALYESLSRQIKASEPAVELKMLDRPQIDLIYEKARKRLDVFLQRRRVSGRAIQSYDNLDYSYRRENFQPLGLQLFLHRVQPGDLPLEHLVRERPRLRHPGVSPDSPKGPVLEKARESYHLREGSRENPYVWDFDLCALTLGNFNYRKMSLVRDYNLLVQDRRANPAFDEVFSLNGEEAEAAETPPLSMEDQHLIVEADPTQQSAVAAARSGRNLIIQGPPGTGKSQTITNLIADYVANGKRVLFVCEKRAALDVVYHRLASQGLDRVTCLIHDSQSDKKAFIQDLRSTYDAFTSEETESRDWDGIAGEASRTVRRELEVVERFAEAMERRRGDGTYSVAELLERLVVLGGGAEGAGDDESLPGYEDWVRYGAAARRLALALADVDLGEVFSATSFRVLKRECYGWENPVSALRGRIAKAREDVARARRESSKFAFSTATCSLDELLYLSFVAESAQFLARRNLLSLLDAESEAARAFERFQRKRDRQLKKLEKARGATSHWKTKIAPGDVDAALSQAVALENSFLRFVQPGYWRLRGVMRSHYDFGAHAVAPPWSLILSRLRTEHEEEAKLGEMDEEMAAQLGVEELEEVSQKVGEFAARRISVAVDREDDAAFFEAVLRNDSQSAETVELLAGMQEKLRGLIDQLDAFLVEAGGRTLEETAEAIESLDGVVGLLPEILPELTDLREAPAQFFEALRSRGMTPDEFECACAAKSLELAYREDRSLKRFEGWMLRRHVGRVRKAHAAWLELNGSRTVARVGEAFRTKCETAGKPAAQLTAREKDFKKRFNKGRRELEHEFGKTMRYRSIRDLSSGFTGEVVTGLKPVWLMSPLSISDTIALGEVEFDVVVFDEASQIRLEEAVPAIYRAAQVVVVGDEMQLPPTDFFAAKGGEDDTIVFEDEEEEIEEYDLGADSFLVHAGRALDSTMLGWHYRSRYESLIGFSNAQFYNGNLLTIPDLRAAPGARDPIVVPAGGEIPDRSGEILARSISFHFQEGAVYEHRRNRGEARYIAEQVRALLARETGLSIGIVAFSEAQQGEIEAALERLAGEDDAFRSRLAAEFEREEDGQFCGLFVKNLENVQGDERDVMLLSICYGPDAKRKMRMNFGPINRTGGEKRLNVIFSRAKRHMAIVSSIRSPAITNDYNDGARCLKQFLEYAEAVSAGDETTALRILGGPAGPRCGALGGAAVGDALQEALEERGYVVDRNVGQSEFRCDLALRHAGETDYRLGVLLVDAAGTEKVPVLERYVWRPAMLQAFDWSVFEVLGKDWHDSSEEVLEKIERLMSGKGEDLREIDLEENAK